MGVESVGWSLGGQRTPRRDWDSHQLLEPSRHRRAPPGSGGAAENPESGPRSPGALASGLPQSNQVWAFMGATVLGCHPVGEALLGPEAQLYLGPLCTPHPRPEHACE